MKDDEDILTAARASLVRYLRHKGMRRTPERFAILEKIFLTDSHFYAESLRDVLEADGYHVSLFLKALQSEIDSFEKYLNF